MLVYFCEEKQGKDYFNAGTIIMDDGLVFLARSDGLKCLFEEFVSYK